MRSFALIAAVPLFALTACNFDVGGNSGTSVTANAAAPEVVPDSVTVNGVTYVRAGTDKVGLDKTIPASSGPTPVATPSPGITLPPPISDTGSSVPPNSGTSGAAADHGQ